VPARFARADIDAAVTRLAGEISRDHQHGLVLVGVLKGCLPFLADLVRALTVVPVIDFLAISPYRPGTGRVRLLMDLRTDIGARPVVLVDDVIDTGLTGSFLLQELALREPSSLQLCAMFDRRGRRLAPVDVCYRGFDVGDDYLVGYGLDHEGRYRNTSEVLAVDRERLDADPDALVAELYPQR